MTMITKDRSKVATPMTSISATPVEKSPPIATRSPSNIGRGLSINGEVFAEEDFSVEGRISGLIRSKGTVIVLPGSQVIADIVADSVVIGGRLEGNVQAVGRIDIQSDAVLIGNATCSRLSIADGAIFKGQIDLQIAGKDHWPPALQDSRDAEEGDRAAEADIEAGRYLTFEDDSSLEEHILTTTATHSKSSHLPAERESH